MTEIPFFYTKRKLSHYLLDGCFLGEWRLGVLHEQFMGSTEADHINTPGIPRVLMAKDPIDVIKNHKCDHSVHTKNHYDKTIRNSYNVRPESLDTQKNASIWLPR